MLERDPELLALVHVDLELALAAQLAVALVQSVGQGRRGGLVDDPLDGCSAAFRSLRSVSGSIFKLGSGAILGSLDRSIAGTRCERWR